jgi:site-specific DNA-methyltransferase (adenine-specific)
MNKAPRNRTIDLTAKDRKLLGPRLLALTSPAAPETIINRTINQDLFQALPFLPDHFVDLLFIDPPYNLDKKFNGRSFRRLPLAEYAAWMHSFMPGLVRTLKANASIYICGDWRSSAAIHLVGEKYFQLRNRITFEREKGRGSKKDWKNSSEDIWFFTRSDEYFFNVDAVKIKRKVIAPYRENGKPKDWAEETDGKYRLTHPSNFWTDLTIPFWSMPENTPHPTQKPEKLLAKIILASSREGDVILDPFAGAGTAGVVAHKLGRKFTLIEIDRDYCLLAEKRLRLAAGHSEIQGYKDGVFWERNTRNRA